MNYLVSAIEYLMSIYMMLGGYGTALNSNAPYSNQYSFDGTLAHIMSAQPSLVLFGLIIFTGGFLLMYCKIRKDWAGQRQALYSIFFINTFVLLLEILIFGVSPVEWIESLVLVSLCILFLIYRR